MLYAPGKSQWMAAGMLSLAMAVSGCDLYNNFMAAQATPPMPTLPEQAASAPALNQQLLGEWSASYPGGPFRVTIQNDPMVLGTNYVGTLTDGGYGTFRSGAVVFRATPDQAAGNLATGTQLCPDPGYLSSKEAQMTLTIDDANHFTVNLAQKGVCSGFPVSFTRR